MARVKAKRRRVRRRRRGIHLGSCLPGETEKMEPRRVHKSSCVCVCVCVCVRVCAWPKENWIYSELLYSGNPWDNTSCANKEKVNIIIQEQKTFLKINKK